MLVTVYSTDVTKVSDTAPYRRDKTFAISVTLTSFTSVTMTYEYASASETTRRQRLAFELRDYCLGVTYS